MTALSSFKVLDSLVWVLSRLQGEEDNKIEGSDSFSDPV